MKLFGAMILGLAAAGPVEYASSEEKFMKREIEYCASQRLSPQGIELSLKHTLRN